MAELIVEGPDLVAETGLPASSPSAPGVFAARSGSYEPTTSIGLRQV